MKKNKILLFLFLFIFTGGIIIPSAVYANDKYVNAKIGEKKALEHKKNPGNSNNRNKGSQKQGKTKKKSNSSPKKKSEPSQQQIANAVNTAHSGGGSGIYTVTNSQGDQYRCSVERTSSNTSKKWLKDNFFRWEVKNQDTGINEDPKNTETKKYEWIPRSAGKHIIRCTPNSDFQNCRVDTYRVYTYEWYGMSTGAKGAGKLSWQKRTTSQGVDQNVYDESRTQVWRFVVTADMIGKPVTLPNVAEDVEIPCDYELVL